MLGRQLVVLAILAVVHVYPAVAADNSLRGQFAFNWYADPTKVKCLSIGDQLLAVLSSPKFRCDLSPQTSTASHVPAAGVCSATDGKSEYLIFGTLAACENERKTQAANAD
jgi:hypothetical protein